jgi:cyanate permease
VGAVRNALLRGDVLLLSVQYFCWSLGVYGFVLWLPTIVHRGATMSMAQTGLLSALPYLAAILLMLFVSHISDKTQKRRSLVWPFLLTSGIALAASFFFSQKNFTLTFLALVIGGGCMYAPYGPFFAIIPERVARNVTAEVFALSTVAERSAAFSAATWLDCCRRLRETHALAICSCRSRS